MISYLLLLLDYLLKTLEGKGREGKLPLLGLERWCWLFWSQMNWEIQRGGN